MTAGRFFANFTIAVLAFSAAVNLNAQTKDFDFGFGQDGKPVQTGGLTVQVPVQPNTAAPEVKLPAPSADATASRKNSETPSTVSAGKTADNVAGTFGVLVAIVLAVVAIFWFRRRANQDEDEDEQQHHAPRPTPPAAPAPQPLAQGTPRMSPAAAAARNAAPAAAATVVAPAPAPTPAPVAPPVAPLIALLALSLFGVHALKADSRVATINSVYPSAVAQGTSVMATVKGAGLDGLVGCAIAIPDVGCGVDHVASASEAVIRVTAGGGAPALSRGTLRLRFTDGAYRDYGNIFAVATVDQIGTAMLARHVTPPQAASTSDTTARNEAHQALLEARAAQRSANRAVAQAASRPTAPAAVSSARALSPEEKELFAAMTSLTKKLESSIPGSQSQSAPADQYGQSVTSTQAPAASAASVGVIVDRLTLLESHDNETRGQVNGLTARIGGVQQNLKTVETRQIEDHDTLSIVGAAVTSGSKSNVCAAYRRLYDQGQVKDDPKMDKRCKLVDK